MKENAVHKLDNVVGKRTTTRRAIYDALFGDSGLSACADVISFDAAVDRFRDKELAAGPPNSHSTSSATCCHCCGPTSLQDVRDGRTITVSPSTTS